MEAKYSEKEGEQTKRTMVIVKMSGAKYLMAAAAPLFQVIPKRSQTSSSGNDSLLFV